MVILVPKLAIIVADPLIGRWSDCLSGGLCERFGRRRPFLWAGTVLSAATFIALFSVIPPDTAFVGAVFMGTLYLIHSLSFSLFAVPYVALPPELSVYSEEQTRLISARMVAVFIGVICGAALAPTLVAIGGGGLPGYQAMAVSLAVACVLAMSVSSRTAPRTTARQGVKGPSLWSDFRCLMRQRALLLVLGVFFVGTLATATLLAAAPFFVTIYLNRPEADLGFLLLAQLVMCLPLLLVWGRSLPRIGHQRALTAATALAALSMACYFVLPSDAGLVGMIACAMFNALGASGLQVAGFAALAHHISDDNSALGGLMTGLWTATEKVGLALGPALCAMILEASGFVSQTPRDDLPVSAIGASQLAMSIAPASVMLAACAISLCYARCIAHSRNVAAPQPGD